MIAYDVQFTEPSDDPDADNALIEATRAAGNVVLATTEIAEDGRPASSAAARASRTAGRSRPTRNVRTDPDGRSGARRSTLRDLDSLLDRAALRVAHGREFTTPPGDTAWIDFAGPPGTVPLSQLRRRAARATSRRRRCGTRSSWSAPRRRRSRTSTRRRRPGQGRWPGPEIQAQRDQHGARGFPLRTAPGWLDALLLIVLGVAGAARGAAAADRRSRSRSPASLHRGAPRRRPARVRRRAAIVTVVYRRSSPPSSRITATARDPRHHRRLRARQHARRVRALRARVGGRPGARRTPTASASAASAARRRSCSATCAASRAFAETLEPEQVIDVAQPLPDRDERGDPRPRRHARRLHGRRHHGRLRRAAPAGRPRRPRARRRPRHARPARGLQPVAARRATCTTASRWASASTAAP